jgi:hypothetical protein
MSGSRTNPSLTILTFDNPANYIIIWLNPATARTGGLFLMLVKRLILTVISLAFGVIATTIITWLINTTVSEYGGVYFFFTALALAIALGIWLDKFMATDILPK